MKVPGNLVWLIFGGIVIAIEYFTGIPFGMLHFKMTAIALSPFGRDLSNV